VRREDPVVRDKICLGKRLNPTGGKDAPFSKEELDLAKFSQPSSSMPNREEEKTPPSSSFSWLF